MSHSFRDKGRLSDRFRNKSGDEILQSLREQLDQDKKMFFDSTPAWGESAKPSQSPFNRAGFPFDTDDEARLPRSSRLQKHLDELATRHPEFAEHLRPDMTSGFRTWGPRHRHGSGGSSGIFSSEDDASDSRSQASGGSEASGGTTEQAPPTAPPAPEPDDPSRPRNKLPQYGLRNTVDLGGAAQKLAQSERNQRSWSAPPDARNNEPAQPKRFVSRIEIQPSMPGVQQQNQQPSSPPVYSSSPGSNPGNPGTNPGINTGNPGNNPGKPPVAPKQAPQKSGSNIRHIPIFVEGRDEPVLPKDTTDSPSKPPEHFTEFPGERHHFPDGHFPDRYAGPQFTNFHQQFFGPRPHGYGSPPQHAFHPQQQQQPQPPQQQTHGFHTQASQQQPPVPPQKRPTASQTPPTKRPTDSPPPPQQTPQPPPPPVNDPLAKVAVVQKDVDALTEQVGLFSGTSRADKQYIYLDEMLTRNLLRLDDIETQGKENIRQARKDTIRSIQRAISMLEAKAPLEAPKTEGEERMDTAGEDCPAATALPESGESDKQGDTAANVTPVISKEGAANIDTQSSNETTKPADPAAMSSENSDKETPASGDSIDNKSGQTQSS